MEKCFLRCLDTVLHPDGYGVQCCAGASKLDRMKAIVPLHHADQPVARNYNGDFDIYLFPFLSLIVDLLTITVAVLLFISHSVLGAGGKRKSETRSSWNRNTTMLGKCRAASRLD